MGEREGIQSKSLSLLHDAAAVKISALRTTRVRHAERSLAPECGAKCDFRPDTIRSPLARQVCV